MGLTLAHHLGGWIEVPGQYDPRGAEPFEERERRALAAFLLTGAGIEVVARGVP